MATRGGRGGWGARGGLPAAPGVQLDQDLVAQTLASGHGKRTAPAKQPSLSDSHANPHVTTATTPATPSTASRVTGVQQPYDLYIVLDFEATCEAKRRIPDPEVIEFPFVVVEPDTPRIVAEFQRYVRPLRHPDLSAFCTTLTGIDQATVNKAEPFPQVYAEAKQYLAEVLGAAAHDADTRRRSYCVVTCGDWDLKTMLPTQLRVSGGDLGVPPGFQRWCNLKTFMKRIQPPLRVHGHVSKLSDMPDLLEAVGLKLEGRHHSGIDDCRNIARVLMELMKRGHVVRPTFSLTGPVDQAPAYRLSASDAAALPAWTTVKSDLSPFTPATTADEGVPVPEPAPKQTRTDIAPPRGARGRVSNASPPARLPAIVVDATRDAAHDLVTAQSQSGRTLQLGELRTVSKALSYILRHGADEAGIPITANGYCRLSALLAHPPLQRRSITPADVARVVLDNDKQRFRMVYAEGDATNTVYLAASQGHSLPGVEVDLRTIQTPADATDCVIHGTYFDAFRKIRSCGYLSTMSRHHIHFAKGFPKDTGVISGMRGSAQVVLYLDVEKCLADGVLLLESVNGVILTPGVGDTGRLPLSYIRKAVDRESGANLSLR